MKKMMMLWAMALGLLVATTGMAAEKPAAAPTAKATVETTKAGAVEAAKPAEPATPAMPAAPVKPAVKKRIEGC